MLSIFNSLSRKKETFVPIDTGKVRIYVCGMTVYDYCHLGHGRVMVVYDMVVRWLRASGFDVTYVRNITDVDDKIIRRAQENQESIRSLSDRFICAMHEDAAALGVLPPDHEPRATDYIARMQSMIARLEQNGLAYIAQNQDVCFAVRKFLGYGKLSGKSLDELRAGERVEVAEGKRDPLDFVLWKPARQEDPAEVKWDSPWGPGRPGWHIECSAMSSDLLGEYFDIHGGGQDLQFPHHENEIAQSEGATGHAFVKYWMHNGFVRIDDEKMSKSLGNFFTVREVLAKYDPEVLRFFLLRAHYRSALNYSDAHLNDARQSLCRLYMALRTTPPVAAEAIDWQHEQAVRFRAAMDDDFNTAGAIAVLFELATETNRSASAQLAALLQGLGRVLGLLERDPSQFLQGCTEKANGGIVARIDERAAAKKARDFARADAIRDELLAEGIVLEDTPQGTIWRRC